MTEDKLAKEIIAEYKREEHKQSNSRNLWQRTADAMYPYAQITAEFLPGTAHTKHIYDVTPMQDAKKMVAGFKQVLMPSGQTFFEIKVNSRYSNDEKIQRYLSQLTEQAHEAIFASNLPIKIDDVLRSWILFGPGAMFQEWTKKKGLNYKYCKIGSYVIFEDDSENVIGSIHRYKRTAADVYQKYKEKAGPSVVKSMEKPETMFDEYWFLYKIMPREVNPRISNKVNYNMPYGVWIVNEKDQVVVDTGGFPENKYIIGRWDRPEYEKDGRGIGTEILPQVDILFEMTKNFLECGNKWVNPARQALADSVEGEIRTGPGGITWVNQIDAVRAMDTAMSGNYPISEKSLDRQTEIIHDAFFRNAFDPLQELKGDRRTTLEIQERIRGTLKHLGPPAGRIWKEFLSPLIEYSILDLIRNHAVDEPPAELAGVTFGIEYVGPLALTLKSEQTRGFQEWINVVGAAHTAFPEKGIADNVDFDDAIPRMGRTFGVNAEDIATAEERQAIRQARQEDSQRQQALMAAQVASKAAKDGSTSPEEGSPTEALMAGMGG